jgi:hypothetical protein
MIRLLLPIAMLSIAACQPVPPQTGTPAPPAEPTACGAEKVAGFVGKTRTDALATEVARVSGAKNIRWISPGMAVTMDYREDRLNVDLDDKGVITRLYCS